MTTADLLALETEFEQAPNPSLRLEKGKQLFRAYQQTRLGNWTARLLQVTLSVADLATQFGTETEIVDAWNNLGIGYELNGAYQQCFEYWSRARAKAKSISYLFGEATALLNTASYLSTIGDHANAFELGLEGLRYYELAGATRQRFIGELILASILLRNKQYAEAITRFTSLARAADTEAHRHLKAEILNNLGTALRLSGKIEEAAAAFEEMRQTALERGDELNLGLALFGIGSTDLDRNRFERARAYYAQAQSILEAHKRKDNLVYLYLYFGRLYAQEARAKDLTFQ